MGTITTHRGGKVPIEDGVLVKTGVPVSFPVIVFHRPIRRPSGGNGPLVDSALDRNEPVLLNHYGGADSSQLSRLDLFPTMRDHANALPLASGSDRIVHLSGLFPDVRSLDLPDGASARRPDRAIRRPSRILTPVVLL